MSAGTLDGYIENRSNHKLLTEVDVTLLVQKETEIVSKENNVVSVPAPCTIVGDIHGQFHDLLGWRKKYLDRGFYSVETVSILVALKPRTTVADLLWFDPEDARNGFGMSPRGAAWTFGSDSSEKFKQLVMEGFSKVHNRGVVTLCSAPNYGYCCGNQGAIMELDDGLEEIMRKAV